MQLSIPIIVTTVHQSCLGPGTQHWCWCTQPLPTHKQGWHYLIWMSDVCVTIIHQLCLEYFLWLPVLVKLPHLWKLPLLIVCPVWLVEVGGPVPVAWDQPDVSHLWLHCPGWCWLDSAPFTILMPIYGNTGGAGLWLVRPTGLIPTPANRRAGLVNCQLSPTKAR